MQMYPSQFPPKRRRKATRRAELRIFNALASSNLAGFAYYEWRKDFDDIELDFAIWMRDHGRAALQVKGGGHELRQGEFYLHTRDGAVSLPASPLDEAWLAALDLHDDIVDKLAPAYDPFVLPVLCFPDMLPTRQSKNSRTVSGFACSGSATNPTYGCRRSCWLNRCGRCCPPREYPVRCSA